MRFTFVPPGTALYQYLSVFWQKPENAEKNYPRCIATRKYKTEEPPSTCMAYPFNWRRRWDSTAAGCSCVVDTGIPLSLCTRYTTAVYYCCTHYATQLLVLQQQSSSTLTGVPLRIAKQKKCYRRVNLFPVPRNGPTSYSATTPQQQQQQQHRSLLMPPPYVRGHWARSLIIRQPALFHDNLALSLRMSISMLSHHNRPSGTFESNPRAAGSLQEGGDNSVPIHKRSFEFENNMKISFTFRESGILIWTGKLV